MVIMVLHPKSIELSIFIVVYERKLDEISKIVFYLFEKKIAIKLIEHV